MTGTLILLADDDRDTLEAYDALFQARGWTTQPALDGRTALAKAIELRPDVVVLDVALPFMDGLEVLYRLRAHPECKQIPVIVVSGLAFPDDIARAQRVGCDAVLVKPCDPDELCRTVDLLLQRSARAAVRGSDASQSGHRRPSKPRRASRRVAAQAPAGAGHPVADLESLSLWADFLDRQAAGLRQTAQALRSESRLIRARRARAADRRARVEPTPV